MRGTARRAPGATAGRPGRARRRGAALAAAVVVVAGPWARPVDAEVGAAPAQDQGSDLESAKEGYDEAVAQESAVLAEYDASVQRAAALAREVAALDTQLAVVEREHAAAEESVRVADAEVATARQRLADTEAQLVEAQRILRLRAVDSYIGAGEPDPRTRSILSSDSAADVGKTTVYAGVIVEDQQRTVELVTQLEAQATALRAEAEDAQARATQARDDVAGRRDELTSTRSQQVDAQAAATESARRQQALLADVQATRNDYLLRIAELSSASDAIGDIMGARQAGQQLPASTARIFSHPVEPMRVGSPFGPRLHPVFGEIRVHRGADLTAGMGQPIRAAADGVVAIAEVRGGYGNCIVIDHGNGLSTLYAHQSAFAVAAGDQVKRGDVIGAVGSTGVSTGPHLHFEVRIYGDAVDPVPFLEPF